MSVITIIGAGMMGSALAFPARENGHTVRLTGTPLDREIIENCRKFDQHPKFDRPFPSGVEYYHFEEVNTALQNSDLIICGVSSFGVEWFAENVLPLLPAGIPVLSVTKGLLDQEFLSGLSEMLPYHLLPFFDLRWTELIVIIGQFLTFKPAFHDLRITIGIIQ